MCACVHVSVTVHVIELAAFLMLTGVMIIDDDRIIAHEDVVHGFRVWQVSWICTVWCFQACKLV